jgi:hypothetical protein
VKPGHLILIVAIGTSLIALAPTAEKAGQAIETTQDVKVMPAQQEPATSQATIVPASFDGETENLTEH